MASVTPAVKGIANIKLYQADKFHIRRVITPMDQMNAK